MTSTAPDPVVSAPLDHVSPELVLVDAVLAVRARELLVDPVDARSQLRSRLRPSRGVTGPPSGRDSGAAERDSEGAMRRLTEAADVAEGRSAPLFPRGRAVRRVAGIVAAVAAAGALALLAVDPPKTLPTESARPTTDTRVGERSTPPAERAPAQSGSKGTTRSTAAGAQEEGQGTGVTATGDPEVRPEKTDEATPKASRNRSSAPRVAKSPPTPRHRLAWLPVADATGYRVELFRGRSRVSAATTTAPSMTIPATWTFGGRKLEPGEYRFYVWAAVSGGWLPEPVLQGKLVVPRR